MCNNISHRSWSEAGFKQRSTEVKDGEGNHSKPSCRNVESQRCQKSPWFSRFLDCVIQCHSNTKTLDYKISDWFKHNSEYVIAWSNEVTHACKYFMQTDPSTNAVHDINNFHNKKSEFLLLSIVERLSKPLLPTKSSKWKENQTEMIEQNVPQMTLPGLRLDDCEHSCKNGVLIICKTYAVS